jgi:hypothetical protein
MTSTIGKEPATIEVIDNSGTPEHVADVVLFLVTGQRRAVHGAVDRPPAASGVDG